MQSSKKADFLLFLLLGLQLIVLFLPFSHAQQILARSFNGRALLVAPTWLELAILFSVVWLLAKPFPITFSDLKNGVLRAVILMLFPLLSGLALYDLLCTTFSVGIFDLPTLLAFLRFVLSFWAVNLTWQYWSKNLWLKILSLLIFALLPTLSYTSSLYLIVGLLNGQTLLLVLTILIFHRTFEKSPFQALTAASTIGLVNSFWIIGGKADNVFTLFVPMLVLLLGSSLIAKKSIRTILKGLILSVLVSFIFGTVLPETVKNSFFESIKERGLESWPYSEKVGSITIHYQDERVLPILHRMARVLEAANETTRELYGISPNVKHLYVAGFAPGGFHVQFPDAIVGNLISPRFVDLCLDSTFLNLDSATIDFPDPVNSILHEYAHLFGIVEYLPWVFGAEEEGWATFAAVTFSRHLFEKYGPSLWKPAYDYRVFAQAITDSNLKGRPVAWSHPEEYSGFQFWYQQAQKLGEKELFHLRWQLTQRRAYPPRFYKDDPSQAHQLVKALGKKTFLPFAQLTKRPLKEVWPFSAKIPLLKLMPSVDIEKEKRRYQVKEERLIDPAIPLPGGNGKLDFFLALALIALIFTLKKKWPVL